MAAYTAILSGNVNVGTNWSPTGIPGQADTVTIGAFTMRVPGGYTWNPGAISMTGTGTSTRAELIVEDGGALTQAGILTINAYNRIRLEGACTWDNAGFDVNWTVNAGSAQNNNFEIAGTSSSAHARIADSIGGAYWGSSGAATRTRLDWQYFTLKNIGFRLGGSFYAGHGINVGRGCFIDLYASELGGGLNHVDDDWIFEYVDIRGTNAAGGEILQLRSAQGPGAGTFRCRSITVDSQAVGKNIRTEYMQGDLDQWVVKNCLMGTAISNSGDLTNCLYYADAASTITAVGGNRTNLSGSYMYMEGDNPHTVEGYAAVDDCIIEATYAAGATDCADHFIVPTSSNFTLSNTLVIDKLGGVLINALGAAKTGVYTAEHNTIVVDVPNGLGRVYGSLARTETGGTFAGTLNLDANLCVVKTNPNAYTNIRAINIDSAGDDQVTTMDHNSYVGYGTLQADRLFGVTSATKTYGDAAWGLNDLTDISPDFVDWDRNLTTFQATQNGGGTAVDAIDDALLLNGYNSVTEDQSGVTAGFTLTELNAWVKGGFAPTAIAYDGTGPAGTTIGAVAYSAGSVVTSTRRKKLYFRRGNKITYYRKRPPTY